MRAQDGQIVAIGGLMKQTMNDDRSQMPGAGDIPVLGNLFRNTSRATVKRELVILLKPTVIQNDASWQQDILESQRRVQGMRPNLCRRTGGDVCVQWRRKVTDATSYLTCIRRIFGLE